MTTTVSARAGAFEKFPIAERPFAAAPVWRYWAAMLNMLRRLLGRYGLSWAAALAALTLAVPAQALPSFTRQTGEPCAACHVGAYGPQLTPHGILFKLGGYTDTDGKGGNKIPLSGMATGSFTRTARAQDEIPAPGTKRNNNLVFDGLSGFVAGRAGDHFGSFVEVGYDNVGRQVALGEADLRGVLTTKLFDKETIFGLSLNNNPGVQDPFNTNPVWGFPYVGSGLGFGTGDAGTLLNGGLEHTVGGLSAYGFWNNMVYAELGTYRTLSRWVLRNISQNLGDDPGRLGGNTLYWRLALFRDLRKQAFSAGIFGLNAGLQPDRLRNGPKNNYRDIGVDASYQFLGTRKHIGTLYGSYIHERQTRHDLIANGEADNLKGSLNEFKLAASYYYDHTYGLTVSRFASSGSRDATLYGDGFSGGSPGTSGYILQADWTPFGKESSWGAPWANLRLGAQYTWYGKFNGAKRNYDGAGRDARDNNTLFLFVTTSF
jgi:hypothetical protein